MIPKRNQNTVEAHNNSEQYEIETDMHNTKNVDIKTHLASKQELIKLIANTSQILENFNQAIPTFKQDLKETLQENDKEASALFIKIENTLSPCNRPFGIRKQLQRECPKKLKSK